MSQQFHRTGTHKHGLQLDRSPQHLEPNYMSINVFQYQPGKFIIVKNLRLENYDGITGTRSRGPDMPVWDGVWSGNSWVSTAHFALIFDDSNAARACIAEHEEAMRQAP